MQAVLCLVLLGTLGLAALVRNFHARRLNVVLAAETSIAHLRIRPPVGWTLRASDDGVILEEPVSRGRPGRRMQIWAAPVDVFLSPLEFLVRSADLRVRDASTYLTSQSWKDNSHAAIQATTIGGWPGVAISQTRTFPGSDPSSGQVATFKQILACATLPTGRAVLLRLDGQGIFDPSDEELVARVGQSLSLENQPGSQAVADVTLDHGITVTVPAGFMTADDHDPFRHDRWLVAGDGGWMGIDLVPCILLPGQDGDILPSLLMMRDPFFRPTNVERVDENTWMCRRRGDELFPAVAYLRTDNHGLAVLAEFRWSSQAHAQAVSVLWAALAAGIDFSRKSDLTPLIEAGAAARKRMVADTAQSLNAGHVIESWQYYQESSPQTVPVSIEYVRADGMLNGSRLNNYGVLFGGMSGELCKWSLSADWSQYDFTLRRFGAEPVVSQATHLRQGTLWTRVSNGAFFAQSSSDELGLYVPGPLLAVALGHLPPKRLILRTDSIPGPQARLSPALMNLVLEPATDMPKSLPPSTQPMSCWRVQVSGSGQSSRWYFDPAGRLHSIAFPGGIHLIRQENADSAEEP